MMQMVLPEGYAASKSGNGNYEVRSAPGETGNKSNVIHIVFQRNPALHAEPVTYLRQRVFKILGDENIWGIYKTATATGAPIVRQEVLMPNFLPRRKTGDSADYLAVTIDADSQDSIDQLAPVAASILRAAAQP
jgi:hypothetical protein